jgi:hypothetical protein
MLQTEKRQEKRFHERLPVRLLTWDGSKIAFAEDTITEDISPRGMAVVSSRPLSRGRYLQVVRPPHTKSLIARVRGRSFGRLGGHILHLQFINQVWPLGSACIKTKASSSDEETNRHQKKESKE